MKSKIKTFYIFFKSKHNIYVFLIYGLYLKVLNILTQRFLHGLLLKPSMLLRSAIGCKHVRLRVRHQRLSLIKGTS